VATMMIGMLMILIHFFSENMRDRIRTGIRANKLTIEEEVVYHLVMTKFHEHSGRSHHSPCDGVVIDDSSSRTCSGASLW